ncbi:glycosyltransferase family 4 protein [Acinetobacter sp. ANC 4173]|uniref:glycosyltransferase family 4 protein n=1 Tax=Acinetobacter sp. ANC 4173 TaxID=2529837 RepID=UPI001D0D98D5|nr:glycosyltransferase family 4 protein [Acinetobacter sp. ANC 4173]
MSKDVILDKYARLYEMPHQLSLLGHEVAGFCLSYQSHAEGVWDETTAHKKLIWSSKSYLGMKKVGLLFYPLYLLKKIADFQPDIIIAASDIPHIIWGAWLAKKLDKPFAADLYDNFESYGQAKIPLFRNLFHKALDQASLVMTTSHSLAKKIRTEHPIVKHVLALPSVIDKALFKVGDQQQARQQLNLPLDVPLIGTAGGLTKMKGITDLFRAWDIIKQRDPRVHLVLAGPIEAQTPIPQDERVIYLGLLQHQQVVTLFQSLDIGVLCIPDDAFGQYCFPQKAYEMLATELTIVSTAIGDMVELVGKHQELLYSSGNFMQFADRVMQQLQHYQKLDVHIPDWSENIQTMNGYLIS